MKSLLLALLCVGVVVGEGQRHGGGRRDNSRRTAAERVTVDRHLLGDLEQAVAAAEELKTELLAMEDSFNLPEELKHPLIERRCQTESQSFFEMKNGSYAACFLLCEFIDYCDLFIFTYPGTNCGLYHAPEVVWDEAADDYCWEYGMQV